MYCVCSFLKYSVLPIDRNIAEAGNNMSESGHEFKNMDRNVSAIECSTPDKVTYSGKVAYMSGACMHTPGTIEGFTHGRCAKQIIKLLKV